jgi:glycosyltransferase involved in cell wall biosynthesis
MKPTLSVVVPAYNEASNFKQQKLEGMLAYLGTRGYPVELVLVDDGSSDVTLDRLTEFANKRTEIRVLAEPHRGKAGAVMAGMLAAQGKYRLFTDFDQSTPIEEIEKMLPFFDRGYDIVIGSREVEGAARKKEPWYRHLMGRGFNWAVQILAVRGIHDTQCGFKMMTDKAAEDLFPRLKATIDPKKDAFTGAFDVELLFLGRKLNYRIAEVPVQWEHVKTQRVSPIKDSLRMFWQLVMIRAAHLSNRYEA